MNIIELSVFDCDIRVDCTDRQAESLLNSNYGWFKQPVNDVLYFCTACRRIHPMGVSLPLEVGFLNTKTVSEAYSGKPLPSYVAMLVGSSVTCSETGKSFVLEDINKLYLTPVLEPWCCLKRVWNRAIMVTAQFFSPFRSGTGIALSLSPKGRDNA